MCSTPEFVFAQAEIWEVDSDEGCDILIRLPVIQSHGLRSKSLEPVTNRTRVLKRHACLYILPRWDSEDEHRHERLSRLARENAMREEAKQQIASMDAYR